MPLFVSSTIVNLLRKAPKGLSSVSPGLRQQGFSLQLPQVLVRHATKKAGGTVKNGRDSPGQRLGVKKFGGEVVIPGNIIIRQRGQKYHCGANTKMGKDHTIYAISQGFVKFVFDKTKKRQVVNVQAENPNPPNPAKDRERSLLNNARMQEML